MARLTSEYHQLFAYSLFFCPFTYIKQSMYLSIYRIETNENRRGCVIELTKFSQYLLIIKRHLIVYRLLFPQIIQTSKTLQNVNIEARDLT